MKDIDPRRKFNVDELSNEKIEELKEMGLKMIADGKVSVVINGAGLAEKMNLPSPRLCHSPAWPLECSVIEFFLKKLKGLGQTAVKIHGKGYAGNREPIMVLLMINEYEIDIIESFLVGEKYFGYTGIICLSQVSLPLLYFIFLPSQFF